MAQIWLTFRRTILAALRGTPVEALLVLAVAALISCEIQWGLVDIQSAAQIYLPAGLAVCVVFAISALHALRVLDSRARWILTGATLAGASAYGFFHLDVFAETELWRWGFLMVAAVMGVSMVPVAARLGDVPASERFWRYNMRLFGRVAFAGIYALLLWAGVMLGISAVDALFELRVPPKVFAHTTVWILIGVFGLLALGSLDDIKRIGDAFSEQTIHRNALFGTFLFLPLMGFYLLIMYAYLGRVFLEAAIPSNVLSPLALGAGALGYLGMFALQPHLRRDCMTPLASILRAFPAAFVAIVPVGMYAVWVRVEQYGWTEFRYARMAALVCLGAFSIISALRWLRRQDQSLVIAPAIVGVVAVLSALGPWGASNVSAVSQRARLDVAATASGMLGPDGRLLPSDQLLELPVDEDRRAAFEAAKYLAETHGAAALAHLTTDDLSDLKPYDVVFELGMGVPMYSEWLYFHADRDRPVRFDMAGYVTEFGSSSASTTHRGVQTHLDGNELVVRLGAITGRATVDVPPHDGSDGSMEFEPVMLTLKDGDRVVGQVSLSNISARQSGATPDLDHVSGILVLQDRIHEQW